MELTKTTIVNRITENYSAIEKYGVVKIGLFGSYARNANNEKSDIDILVEFKLEATTYDNYFDLIEFLESIFQKKVDLVTIETVSPYISPSILKEVEYIERAA